MAVVYPEELLVVVEPVVVEPVDEDLVQTQVLQEDRLEQLTQVVAAVEEVLLELKEIPAVQV